MRQKKAILANDAADRIVTTIAQAEKQTSGEIRVHLQRRIIGDVYDEAINKFEELGMEHTAKRNGVLIFVVTETRMLAVVGDHGINEAVPEKFWQEIVDLMKERFKQDDLVGGIEGGIQHAGKALQRYFPHQPESGNNASNTITEGK